MAGATPTASPGVPDAKGRPSVVISRPMIRSIPVLGLLDEERLDSVVASARLARFDKLDTVVHKGAAIDHLGVLVEGKLQVVDFLPDGREFGLNIITAGQFFGELSVIDRRPRSASIVAIVPSIVLVVPGTIARRMFYEVPKVAEAIMTHLVGAMRRTSQLRALQAVQNSYQRVYGLLHYLCERDPAGEFTVISDLPTHQQLAIMVNTSRETVTRAMARLAAAGVLRREGRKAIVTSPCELRRLVEGSHGGGEPRG